MHKSFAYAILLTATLGLAACDSSKDDKVTAPPAPASPPPSPTIEDRPVEPAPSTLPAPTPPPSTPTTPPAPESDTNQR